MRVDVLTSGLFDVLGGESVAHPLDATLLGPALVAPLEHDALRWRHIDLPAAGERFDPRTLARELAARASTPSEIIALRGPHRWRRHFAPCPLSRPATSALRQRGHYLITGGLGGVGMALAGHLAKVCRARLVLLSRTGLPPRDAGNRIRAVQALEAAGGEVLVLAADVADERALAAAVDQARARFGPLHGVVHAAGINPGGMLAQRDRTQAEQVLAPKVAGTLALLGALRTQREPLDFLALCSSLDSVLGAVGASDYCAANAFLDALASASEQRIVSISWDAWSEVGMAAETAVGESLRAERQGALLLGMRTAEAIDVFERILAAEHRHVLVSTHDLEARRDAAVRVSAPPPLQASHPRPDLATAFAPPESPTEHKIAAIVQELLGIAGVGKSDDLFELGFDSLLAHRLATRLAQQHGLEVPIAAVFEHPSVADLARFVELSQWADELLE
jgi:NADP-dependent 3-hydroxy acid dehydrogenase YdfG/acyl carrier protein